MEKDNVSRNATVVGSSSCKYYMKWKTKSEKKLVLNSGVWKIMKIKLHTYIECLFLWGTEVVWKTQ